MSRFLGLVLLVGCEVPPTEDLIELSASNGAVLDTRCTPSCADLPTNAMVVFDYHPLVSGTAAFDIERYRIDYQIAEFADTFTVPSYISPLSVEALIGEDTSFSLAVGDSTQRDTVLSALGPDRIDALATLTVVGYDHNNAIIEFSTDFTMIFEDVRSDSDDNTTGTGSSQP